jgi:hypothetical protein
VTSPYYSSDQTEASRAVLDALLAAVPDAILIGGWGTWARAGGAMSHDVDLIVTRGELSQIGRVVDDLSQSHHLAGTKWRGTWRGIHIDLYAPHQSRLGANLRLRVEDLTSYAETVEGRRLLSVPAHIATKVAALLDRPDSLPGRKDRQELLNLLARPDAEGAAAIIRNASERTRIQVVALLEKSFSFLSGDSSLNREDRARLRHMSQRWQHEIEIGVSQDHLPGPSGDVGIDL